jgi:alpha-beta hydrolase superfamily lysophospholipase
MTDSSPPIAASPSIGAARMADGTQLRTLRWQAADEPWGIVEIVHGLGEHGGRYETVAGGLTAAGLEVWSYDHRGNGASGGRRGWVDEWPTLHDDLGARMASLRELYPHQHLTLYAHSLGGLIATGYVLSGRDRPLPDALVLSAPGLDDNLARWKHRAVPVLARIVPGMRIANGMPAGAMSRDPAVDAASLADPLTSTSSTVKLGALGFAEQERVQAAIDAIDAMPVPTYVLHGSDDPIVPPSASARLEGKGNVTCRVHDGLLHECHHEPEHADVLEEVVAWLRETLPGVPGPVPGAPVAVAVEAATGV